MAGAASAGAPPDGRRSARLTRISSVLVSAIAVSGLRKSYGAREVLHGISFTVRAAEVLALLGVNGAGKTSAL